MDILIQSMSKLILLSNKYNCNKFYLDLEVAKYCNSFKKVDNSV